MCPFVSAPPSILLLLGDAEKRLGGTSGIFIGIRSLRGPAEHVSLSKKP